LYQFQVRINDIDTAELKNTNGNIKKMSLLARDKYGRILADAYIDNIHINKWMIDNHLALPYDGGHKEDSNIWNEIYDKYWKN
jgi:endonuclease YncB( thermonuclease family)